ncbi:MAG TPA: PhoX family phosphatase [Alphaproteobacteria bacterium]|nr:PhoX family phosphatase [Alphaproteobacteria bacterium]
MSDRTHSTPMRFDDPQDDIGSNPNPVRPIGDIIAARLSRRSLMAGSLATAAVASSGLARLPLGSGSAEAAGIGSSLTFKELARGAGQDHAVAEGYDARVLIRWGDPVIADAPTFDPHRLSAAAQEKQFGYNCDFVGYAALPFGSNSSDRALLCVSHEYTSTDFMWPGMRKDNMHERMTKDMVEVELAAHGASIVEIRKQNGIWSVDTTSRYNRRISLLSTEFDVSGPAAGHDRMKTSADPSGRRVIGTINNCSGGMTPWGTMLSAEENFHQYFAGKPDGSREEANHKRYGITGRPVYSWWGKTVDRFNIEKEPNEPNRFGWVVEIDPYEPSSRPVKRTALGRCKHENASCIVSADGRVVVYSGDDERFEYVYKFVTTGRFNPNDRAANRNLLDDGTLYVARFGEDGKVTWLPLVHGQGPLTAANGFQSQADVLIDTRRAADLLGATPMDRPEDVEANPRTGTVYVMLTNNSNRKAADGADAWQRVNAANPRPNNSFGHVVAMMPPKAGHGHDHAATEFAWTVPILCGDPEKPETGRYANGTTPHGMFAAPDNVAFDGRGRMWITTDQGDSWPKLSKASDGVFAMEVEGPAAYVSKRFYTVPVGAEMCGPCFTPDDRTLFVAVQHPATDGVKESSFDTPATRWPDFKDDMPPRPSVVVIAKRDGGVIGS